MYVISKDFDFCYGHRVWSQRLDTKFAGNMQCQCRRLHGHQGKVKIHLMASHLEYGMVTDFNHLNWLKKFIDDNIDHRFIIDRNDPLFNEMTNLGKGSLEDEHIEYQESFYVVDFVPTSENLAKWMFDLVQEKMAPLGVTVAKVEWFETPKSRSVYSREM